MLPCPIGLPGAVQDLPKLPRLPKRACAGGHRAPHSAPTSAGGTRVVLGVPDQHEQSKHPALSHSARGRSPAAPPKKLQSLPFPTREGNSLHLRQRSFGVCRRGAVQRRYLQCLGAGSRLIFITRERSIWNMNNANCACIDLA